MEKEEIHSFTIINNTDMKLDEKPKEKLGLNSVSKRSYKWFVIENIVTMTVVAGLFAYTLSAWSFIFLINLNSWKSVTKHNS